MASTHATVPAAAELAVENAQAAYLKTQRPPAKAFYLAIAGGFLVGVGYIFYVTSQQGMADFPVGPAKILGGMAFTVGLVVIILTGADLFTSTTMTVMPLYSRKITPRRWLAHWGTSLSGNLLGALLLAVIVFASGQYLANGGEWGRVALETAYGKIHYSFPRAFLLAMLANIMVCLAVYIAQSGRTTTDKILACLGPIPLFASSGFEHSIANMFLLPLGWMIKEFGGAKFWESAAVQKAGITAEQFADFDISAIVINNWIPVLLGNIVGGALVVATYFYFGFVRAAEKTAATTGE
ncbi:formate/nitrite transporter [Actinobaculum suis]|uniref:Formate/nitrite transporter n=1 Tax=Actinobaculum suis TaxID=1657 RepID=A0A7Z8YA24_9ACTO|nr:formate/nitrite transporter family protein [Actinobaculum suis]VDG76818.1 formate/nitrite transporter [Actinobaculum suis]